MVSAGRALARLLVFAWMGIIGTLLFSHNVIANEPQMMAKTVPMRPNCRVQRSQLKRRKHVCAKILRAPRTG